MSERREPDITAFTPFVATPLRATLPRLDEMFPVIGWTKPRHPHLLRIVVAWNWLMERVGELAERAAIEKPEWEARPIFDESRMPRKFTWVQETDLPNVVWPQMPDFPQDEP